MDLRLMLEANNAEDLEEIAPQIAHVADNTHQRVARHACNLCGAATMQEPKNQRLIDEKLKILIRNPSVTGSLLVSHNGIKFQDTAGRKKPLIIGIHRIVYSMAHAAHPYISIIVKQSSGFKCIALQAPTQAAARQLNNDIGAAFQAAYRNRQLRVTAGRAAQEGGSYRFERKPSGNIPFAGALSTSAPLSAETAMEAVEAGFVDRGWVTPKKVHRSKTARSRDSDPRRPSSPTASTSSTQSHRSSTVDIEAIKGSLPAFDIERHLTPQRQFGRQPRTTQQQQQQQQQQQEQYRHQQHQHRSHGHWSVASTRESPTHTSPPPPTVRRNRTQSEAQATLSIPPQPVRRDGSRRAPPPATAATSALSPSSSSSSSPPLPPPRAKLRVTHNTQAAPGVSPEAAAGKAGVPTGSARGQGRARGSAGLSAGVGGTRGRHAREPMKGNSITHHVQRAISRVPEEVPAPPQRTRPPAAQHAVDGMGRGHVRHWKSGEARVGTGGHNTSTSSDGLANSAATVAATSARNGKAVAKSGHAAAHDRSSGSVAPEVMALLYPGREKPQLQRVPAQPEAHVDSKEGEGHAGTQDTTMLGHIDQSIVQESSQDAHGGEGDEGQKRPGEHRLKAEQEGEQAEQQGDRREVEEQAKEEEQQQQQQQEQKQQQQQQQQQRQEQKQKQQQQQQQQEQKQQQQQQQQEQQQQQQQQPEGHALAVKNSSDAIPVVARRENPAATKARATSLLQGRNLHLDSAEIIVRSRASSQRREQLSAVGAAVLPASKPRTLVQAAPNMGCADFVAKVVQCNAKTVCNSTIVADYLICDREASAALRLRGGTLEVGKTYHLHNCQGTSVCGLFYLECRAQDAKRLDADGGDSEASDPLLDAVLKRGLMNMTLELSTGPLLL